jgi:N-acetylneuraminic acid mutarotase
VIGRALSAVLVVLALSAIAPPAIATEMKWSAAAPMPLARSELSATVVEDRLYVAGGIAQLGASPAFQVYDPSANSWRSLAPLPEPRHHFGMAALDGRIYVSGGYRDLPFGADQAQRQTWAYDIAADRWTPAADLPAGRAAHAMAALGDHLYVVGGVGPEPDSVFVYDRRLDAWRRLATALPTPREHLAAGALGGKLYIVGGRWSGVGNLAALEIYEPATKRWSRGPDMPTSRGGLTAAVLDGRIHVTGGEDLDSGATFPAHEIFDPAAGSWSASPPLPTSRHGLASGVIAGRWYVVGGGERAGAMTFISLSDKVEVFGP